MNPGLSECRIPAHVDASGIDTGQCWDNALAESFFSSLKGELIDTGIETLPRLERSGKPTGD